MKENVAKDGEFSASHTRDTNVMSWWRNDRAVGYSRILLATYICNFTLLKLNDKDELYVRNSFDKKVDLGECLGQSRCQKVEKAVDLVR